MSGSARRDLLRALLGVAASGVASAPARAAAPDAGSLAAMRAGGCVLMTRHAITDPGVGDPPGFRLDACATQRNLSAEGRAQATRIGEALRAAAVPIGPVRSSRWCRCLDTARLATGRVEPWPTIDSFFGDGDARGRQTDALRAWALAWRGADNAMLVTHQVNVTALTGEFVAMGETLVLRPERGALTLVGRFTG